MSKKIKYDIDQHACLSNCNTPCPYIADGRKVASMKCQMFCKHHISINEDAQEVTCGFEDERKDK